jgi:hypothetical protein
MQYRLYVLDYGFQIIESHDFAARDDISALERGMFLSATNPVEIWEKSRLVARIGMAGEAIAHRPYVRSTPYMDLAA